MLTGIVFVIVVEIQFNVFADRERRTGALVRGDPLLKMVFVEGFGSGIENQMARDNMNPSFEGQLISVLPGENSVLPVQVRLVKILSQEASKSGN